MQAITSVITRLLNSIPVDNRCSCEKKRSKDVILSKKVRGGFAGENKRQDLMPNAFDPAALEGGFEWVPI
jgi:hypothetical protein